MVVFFFMANEFYMLLSYVLGIVTAAILFSLLRNPQREVYYNSTKPAPAPNSFVLDDEEEFTREQEKRPTKTA